nr:MAG TPA: hypothetical protein [Caudoviricetes sp.]
MTNRANLYLIKTSQFDVKKRVGFLCPTLSLTVRSYRC